MTRIPVVRTDTGESFLVEAAVGSDNVLALKRRITEAQGIAPSNQLLLRIDAKSGAVPVPDKTRLSQLGDLQATPLRLRLTRNGKPRNRQVKVQAPHGKWVLVEITPSDTVATLKSEIAKKAELTEDDLRAHILAVGHSSVADLCQGEDEAALTVEELNVRSKGNLFLYSGIRLAPRPPDPALEQESPPEPQGVPQNPDGSYTIAVLLIRAGTRFEINVFPTETLAAVKRKILVQEGHPLEDQHVMLSGTRVLYDDSATMTAVDAKHGGDLFKYGRLYLVVAVRKQSCCTII